MSNPFVPIRTAIIDWRHDMPFSTDYNDIYFSAGNGLEQARFIFIEGNDLINRWSGLNQNARFNIAETGFGTGLNFLLTWHLWEQYAPESCSLHYISAEINPLTLDDLRRSLKNWPQLNSQAMQLLQEYPILTPGYHHLSFNNGRVTLTLMLGDAFDGFEQLLICGDARLERTLRAGFIDAWYLDGFSPDKNETIWSSALIHCIAMLSKEGTTLATYTAAASVKTALTQAGFLVNKRKGFGPKRHMITAKFISPSFAGFKTRNTPWHQPLSVAYDTKSAIIIGAGLAGCFTANALAQRGWLVTIIDELPEVGQGGSANNQAVLFPKLSAFKSPLNQFMLNAFVLASTTYKNYLKEFNIGELKGSLLLAYNEKERKAHTSLKEWLSSYPQLGQLVDASQASVLSGLPIEKEGVFVPLSGWINIPALCNILLADSNITVINNKKINQLKFINNKWRLDNLETEILILANGPKINSFPQTKHLPIKAIRGQMTRIAANNISSRLQIPICAEGHILPEHQGTHSHGATYDLYNDQPEINPADDLINRAKLGQITADVLWSKKIVGHWSGVRASTPDYLPLVGPIAKAEEFIKTFSGLETNAKRWIAQAGPYYKGLYACAGFGSKGLTTIPLAAEWLAATLNNEISRLPRHLIQAISPARFLRKDIIRGLL